MKRHVLGWIAVITLAVASAAYAAPVGIDAFHQLVEETLADHEARLQALESSPTTELTTTTFGSTSTTQTTTTEPEGELIWYDGFEGGNFNQWTNLATNGGASATIVSSPVHSGIRAARLNNNANGNNSGIRLVWKNDQLADEDDDQNLPEEAYYSAWYYIPQNFTTSWSILHEWKQQQGCTGSLLYAVVLYTRGGDLEFSLTSNVNAQGNWQSNTNRFWDTGYEAPIGRWFEIRSYYKWHQNGQGRVTIWIDGDEIVDIANVTTEQDWDHCAYSQQWVVANYANSTNPSNLNVYVDDASVTLP